MTLKNTHKKRAYEDGCAVAQIMDIIGERWALMVIRELIFGPRRFSDLRAALPGISANVLTQRLASLQAEGVVQKIVLSPPYALQLYELTEWGQEAEVLFRVIGRWAARSPRLCPAPMSVASIILSMRTMFSAERAGDMRATIGFRFGREEFLGQISDGTLLLDVGDAEGADVLFIATPDAMAGVLYGGAPLDAMIEQGALEVDGDLQVARRYLTLFPLPERAPPGTAPDDPRQESDALP